MVIQDQQEPGDIEYMSRKSCVIYDSWGEIIKNLPNEMAGELIKMILEKDTLLKDVFLVKNTSYQLLCKY